MKKSTKIKKTWFPEIAAGGFTSLDGTLEFYSRINALLKPNMTVLDFGGGRGAVLTEESTDYKKQLMTLRGKVANVIVCDVDEVVLTNPGADEAVVIQSGAPLPFADESIDLIVSDFVFEHITDPLIVSKELQRVLKPGGWICARTPNKYCLISLLIQMVHNSKHSRLLCWIQPERQSMDVFPTMYKMNSKRVIANLFAPDDFNNFTYRYEAEPSYFFNSRVVFALMLVINRLTPSAMKTGLFVFLKKK